MRPHDVIWEWGTILVQPVQNMIFSIFQANIFKRNYLFSSPRCVYWKQAGNIMCLIKHMKYYYIARLAQKFYLYFWNWLCVFYLWDISIFFFSSIYTFTLRGHKCHIVFVNIRLKLLLYQVYNTFFSPKLHFSISHGWPSIWNHA